MELQKTFKTYMERYQGIETYKTGYEELNLGQWNYETGCILQGAKMMYQITGDEEYKDYIIRCVDPYIGEDGKIISYIPGEYNLDFLNTGKLLYFLYDVTENEKYRKSIEVLMDQVKHQPRLTTGNFWHKLIYPFQVWLDGVYMCQPFYLEYENRYHKRQNYYDIVNQFKMLRKYLYDEKTDLYYHAYDEYKERDWADKKTGLSPNFWLRSIGWYLMALVDCYELASEELYDCKRVFCDLYREAIHGVLKYQDKESKLFYQLIALSEIECKYLETSGSLMVAYSILKACRLEILLPDKYQYIGKEILQAVVEQKIREEDGSRHLYDTCESAGLGPHHERNGSTEYYLSEPVAVDDPKGMGILMMAYSEWLRIQDIGQEE